MKLSRPLRKIPQSRTVHLAQQGVQHLSRSTIPAQRLTLRVSSVKVPRHSNPHLSNPPHVARHLRRGNLVWAQHLVLVVPLRDSHPREALRLDKVPHQTQPYLAATLLRHKGMVQDNHVHLHQDIVLACQVLQAVCLLRRAWSLVVPPLHNSSLTRCHPRVNPPKALPPQGGSDCSLIVLLSIGIPRLNAFSFSHLHFPGLIIHHGQIYWSLG